ncbi:MAG: RNA polymerase sigma factor (sigma-70 family) [Myxococcota bacterium]|jgi:RNA polymerase sigma factor (sigma-70 family)
MNVPPIDEHLLWQQWDHNQDEDAATALWRSCQRLAVAIAARILASRPDPLSEALGVCDESFFRALQTFQPQRAPASVRLPFRNWFLSIVRNAAIDRRRKHRGIEVLYEEAFSESSDQESRLAHSYDLKSILPLLEDFVQTHYLPSDWAVLEQWMLCRSESEQVPWRALSRRFPIQLDVTIPFHENTVLTTDTAGIAQAVHVLNTASSLQVCVIGFTDFGEPPALAQQRAESVQTSLEGGLKKRQVRGERRLSIEARLEDGPPRVELQIRRGRYHSPDALRMRIEKVILPRAVKTIQRPAPRKDTP